MSDTENEPRSLYPDVEMFLNKLAENKGSSQHRIVCESDGVVTEYWLEGGKVRCRIGLSVRRAEPFAATAGSGLAALVSQLESELSGEVVSDLDSIEIAIGDLIRFSVAMLYQWLLEWVDAELPPPECPTCEIPMRWHQQRRKSFASRLGSLKVNRSYYRCRICESGFFLLDRVFDLEGQTATPGAANLVADDVVLDSFEEASRKLYNLNGLKVPATTLRRWIQEFSK